jgi:hypothetical protein
MSFGRVEVIHETQFQNAAIVAGLQHGLADELSYNIGLKTAPNHELPAVIVIEKLRDKIKVSNQESIVYISPKIQEAQSNQNVTAQAQQTLEQPEQQDRQEIISKVNSFIDMSMIKICPNGYAGSFLDRHLVYTIEDQNRVINLDRGARTLQVSRRFSDFVSVRDYLIAKYPFRCIPRLPSKRVQMFSDEAFLLDRQKSLRRFLGIILHHHMYKCDPLIQAFIYNQKVTGKCINSIEF